MMVVPWDTTSDEKLLASLKKFMATLLPNALVTIINLFDDLQ